jgi:hypothetical protein
MDKNYENTFIKTTRYNRAGAEGNFCIELFK